MKIAWIVCFCCQAAPLLGIRETYVTRKWAQFFDNTKKEATAAHHYRSPHHRPLQKHTVIFVSGMQYSFEEAQELTHKMSQELKGSLHLIYTQSSNVTYDLARAVVERLGKDTSSVKLLLLHVKKGFVQKHHVHIFAHSEGAMIVKNALNKLDKQWYRHIDVYVFGGAALVPRRYGRRVYNYISKSDPIPYFSCPLDVHLARRYRPHHVIFLKKQKKASVFIDHSVDSPTYWPHVTKALRSISKNA